MYLEETQLSDRMNQKSMELQLKAASQLRDWGVTGKVEETHQQVLERWTDFDTQYKVSETTSTVSNLLSDLVTRLGRSIVDRITIALQTPACEEALVNASEKIENFFKPATDVVIREYSEIKELSMSKIELAEQQRIPIQQEIPQNYTIGCESLVQQELPPPISQPIPLQAESQILPEPQFLLNPIPNDVVPV